jgi:hypothetical protein
MAVIFGQELSDSMSIVVYVFLTLAVLILIGSIGYYWSYSRKIERFLARDNENNNMMRHDLVESFVERGEEPWPCSICFHDNAPNKQVCVMCGTPQVVSNQPQNQVPMVARPSGFRRSDFLQRSNSTMLNQQSRVRSFHVRRLKQMQLTARQKAAVRRHLWRRKKGPDGQLRWVRIDADEAAANLEDSHHHPPQLSPPSERRGEAENDDESYEELSTPKSIAELSEPSDTDSMRQDDENIALALRDFGESLDDDDAHGGDKFNEMVDLLQRQKDFHPPGAALARPPLLRATALKALEQAEERPTLAHHPYENPYNLDKIKRQELEEERRQNFTAVSIGYVRHENGVGGFEWAPAVSVNINPAGVIEHNKIECEDDLEEIAALNFQEKNRWFLQQVQKRWRSYEEGHIQFVIRRDFLVSDSLEQMLKCPASRFWERLRIYFENEPGLDAGGLIREWYELLSNALFNDEFGLFISTKGENMGYWINPASNTKIQNHLLYFEFIGRLLGKALIEGHHMKMSLCLPLIKHMLGVPISFSDLEFLDEDLYKNCMWMRQNDQAELLNLDFTVQVMTSEGKSQTVQLVPNGNQIDVTDSNKQKYLELLLQHYMFESISEQLNAFLKGFYDIVPAFLVTVFDYQEFDLMLSGIPDIDVNDWHLYSDVRWIKLEKPTLEEKKILEWFWELLGNIFTGEERARLLQFATGTSRVPVQGFKALTSSDGRVRRFTIQFVPRGPPPTGLMPKGHTCFNRIDLPLYESMEELMKYLTLVINMEITGFWLE